MFLSLRHSILLLWILLPVNEAVAGIITIDDYERNTRWMFLESDAPKEFPDAVSWIAKLNKKKSEGYSDWRLPFTPDGKYEDWSYNANDYDTKTNVTCSDLGHLYYTVKKYDSSVDSTPLLQHSFWLGTNKKGQFSAYKDKDSNNMAWAFDFSTGLQFLQSLNFEPYALAVRTEPLPTSAVPEPNTALLFLTGILCLAYRPLSRNRSK